jgi:hypothetical protein
MQPTTGAVVTFFPDPVAAIYKSRSRRDAIIEKLENRIVSLEGRLNEISKQQAQL